MATKGNNLQAWKDVFLYLIRKGWSRSSDARNTDSLVFYYLNQAQSAFQNALQAQVEVSTSISVAAGDYDYDLPEGCEEIQNVRFRESGGTEYSPLLTEKPSALAIDHYGVLSASPTRDAPTHWCLDPGDPRVFWLMPAPSTAGTLRIEYLGAPRTLFRIFNQSTITADMSYGTALQVEVSNALTENEDIAVDDEFGILPTTNTNTDGSTVATPESPRRWYRIASIESSTAFTLAEAHPDTSSATARFITAQVSDLERNWPGKFGTALVEYAAAECLKGREPRLAAQLAQGAMAAAMNMRVRDGSEAIVARSVKGTPFDR